MNDLVCPAAIAARRRLKLRKRIHRAALLGYHCAAIGSLLLLLAVVLDVL